LASIVRSAFAFSSEIFPLEMKTSPISSRPLAGSTILPPLISSFISWSLSGRIELAKPIGDRKQLDAGEIPANVWKKIADQLHARTNAPAREMKPLTSRGD
jgi:hypothetical protein